MAHILIRMQATATFFPIGRNIGANPRAWRYIGARFPIGNHTQNHPIMTHLSPAAMRAEIEGDARTVRAAIGHPPIRYLRPPGGAWNASVAQVARSLGYRSLVLWDTTDADTALHSHLEGMIRDALRGEAGSILLMHCNRPLSEQILTRVISVYRSRGFHFVTIPQLLGGRLKAARNLLNGDLRNADLAEAVQPRIRSLQ
jgi:peptidoglycan/xylan/chitin deacetylase (PgdA/CDA1 family)